jgi:hypothetical protein
MVDEGPQGLVRQVNEQFLTDPDGSIKSWILDGFAMTGLAAGTLTVTKGTGRAILAQREGAEIHYGAITTEGDATKTLDVSGYANNDYSVYIRFQYVDAETQSRMFWNPSGTTEFAQSIQTRRQANWSLRCELASPGTEWVQIGQITVAAAVITKIKDMRNFYFEGVKNSETLLGTWTWDGTTTILATDTTQVAVNDWVSGLVDGQFFQITAETPNVSVTVSNPQNYTIPTGALASVWVAAADAPPYQSGWGSANDRLHLRDGQYGIKDLQQFTAMVRQLFEDLRPTGKRWWESHGPTLTQLDLAETNALNWVEVYPKVAKNVDLKAVCDGDDDTASAIAVGLKDGANGYALYAGGNRTVTGWAEVNGGAKNLDLYGVAGNGTGTYVAVGETDGDAYIVTGTGHGAYVEQANPLNFDLYGVCFGNSLFVAVGETDGADSYICTSPDGLAPWTQRGAGTLDNVNLRAVAYNGSSLFVAVGDLDVDAYIVTSADGLTWTERSNPANAALLGIAYGSSHWVAVGSNHILRSTDGINWEDVTPGSYAGCVGVAYGGGIFVACGDNGELWVSKNEGATWVQGVLPHLIGAPTPGGVAYSTIARCFIIAADSDGVDASIRSTRR